MKNQMGQKLENGNTDSVMVYTVCGLGLPATAMAHSLLGLVQEVRKGTHKLDGTQSPAANAEG